MGSDNLFNKKKKQNKRNIVKKQRKMRNSIMIICEGKTEEMYFKSFPVINVEIFVRGVGKNTSTLLEDAINRWKEFAGNNEIYESIWIVMDRDSFPQQDYNECFSKHKSLAKKLNKENKTKIPSGTKISINIAYSNQAFELWYLLHFEYLDRAYHRNEFESLLTKRLGKKYQKEDPTHYEYFKRLGKKTDNRQGQQFAIKNAKRLRNSINLLDYYNSNPSTSVYLLVEELNQLLKK